jgi:hypothetical protein
VASRGNATANTWQALSVSTAARYVRFLFANPNKDAHLGYLAEVEFWPGTAKTAGEDASEAESAATAAPTVRPTRTPRPPRPTRTPVPPTETATPLPTATPVPPLPERTGTGVIAGTDGQGAACYAAPDANAEIIGGFPEGMRVDLLGSPEAGWQPVVCDGRLGYVWEEFVVAEGDEEQGDVGTVAPAEVAAAADVGPTPYPVARSLRSRNASSARVLYDGDPETYWATNTEAPVDEAYAVLDLGGIVWIGSVRWIVAVEGLAAGMEVQVSSDRESWTTVAAPGNAPPGEWQEAGVGAGARYVRFHFTNPDGRAQVGGLGEVEVWP